MEMPLWVWGLAFKPLLALLLVVVLMLPLVLFFDWAIPAGRAKQLLWRDMTTPQASTRDRVIAALLVLGAFAAAVGYSIWLNSAP